MTAALDAGSQLLLARVLYWAMPLALLLWAVAAVRRFGAREDAGGSGPFAFARRHAAGLLAALALTVATPFVSAPRMRMQFDETSLCGTAQNMHLHRTAMMGIAALPSGDGLELLDWNLDKRPPLFPFLVSVAHDLTGYRVENAFAINLGLLFLLLATLAVACARRLPANVRALGGVAAPLLVAAVPLVLTAATSAGFELLATLLLAWTIVSAIDYVEAPSAVRGQWLLANALLLALSRYESILLALLVLALVWLRSGRRLLLGRYGRVLLAAGIALLLPIAALLWHSLDAGFYLEAGGRQRVGLGNLATNFAPFVGRLFHPFGVQPFPGLLAVVSAVVYLLWLLRRFARFRDLLVLAPVLAVTAIVWLWFYGDVRETTALRLYLPIAVLAALGPVLLLRLLPWRPVGWLVAVFAAALGAWRWTALAAGEMPAENRAARLLDAFDLVLANVPHDPARTVWVTTAAQYLIVRGHAAMPPAVFAQRTEAGSDPFRDLDVFVVTWPEDERLPWFGDPRSVLAGGGAAFLGSVDSGADAALEVYRLRR
ncbi:MAG: glycosyltransferase family 39 protein [Planctomycetes bacterium]|nr:glycosyltransferase family 39 protein [Planctomycetota bacterium]